MLKKLSKLLVEKAGEVEMTDYHASGILSRLNGKSSTYQENEGVALHSIIEAVSAA